MEEDVTVTDNKNKESCDVCQETFVCFSSLNSHSKRKHRKNLLECSDCGRECNSVNLLTAHMKIKHQLKKNDPVVTGRFNCDSCDVKYQTESALFLHKFKEHGKKLAIICPFCDRVFNKVSNAENLYNHTHKEHKDKADTEEYKIIDEDFEKFRSSSSKTFSCQTCSKSFASSYKLKSHFYKVHNKREPTFLCDKCEKVFKFRGELNFHYQKYHSDMTIVCQECGKSFNHKYNLEIHLKMVHVRNKTLNCDKCDKMFFIPSKLEHHKRTVHDKVKPFKCEFCQYSAAAQGNLNLHRKNQHGAEKLTMAEYNKLHGIVRSKGKPSNSQQGSIRTSVIVSNKKTSNQSFSLDAEDNHF